MKHSGRRPARVEDPAAEKRAPGRWICFSAIAVCAGCTFVAIDDSGLGSASRIRFQSHHTPYATREIIFDHETHSFELCDTCHFGTTTGDDYAESRKARAEATAPLEPVALPSMALCFRCHDGAELTQECIDCHRSNRRDRKPAYHDGIFPRYHKNKAEDESYQCSLCHLESGCRDCHSVRKPLSHTPRFARSTHGRYATHDRRSCATCHEVSYCENCHAQPPPDHTPIFMGGGGHRQAALLRGRGCLVCHSFDDTCAVCHNR